MANNIHPVTKEKPNKFPPPNDRLLRWIDVQPLVGICRSHAHHLVAQGLFPKPRKLVPGGRASAWSYNEIQEWIDQRINQPDSAA
jgi:prophage regulatory protein